MSICKTVGEIMIPVEAYPSVRDNATLLDAILVIEDAQLEVARRKSLPRVLLVFDAIDVMVGYVRRRDILRGLLPEYLLNNGRKDVRDAFSLNVDPNLAELAGAQAGPMARARADRPISHAMRPVDAVLDADDHLLKAIQEMVALDVNLIPVLRDGHLVGVVRSVDVFQAVAEYLMHEPAGIAAESSR